jgi:membrane-bound lytic murein transglycosylase B
MRAWLACLMLSACAAAPATDAVLQRADVQQFIADVSQRNGIPSAEISAILSQARLSSQIIAAISRPAEALPWRRYREIFLQPERIQGGVLFWRENSAALEQASNAYGVPVEILVAVIGVETRYGRNAGGYRVLDALATLAFDYPKRADFFRGELEQFLLLTREQKLEPLELKGSYAGAMGTPQFIPSSFRRFAVDFDVDGRIDIWNSNADAIGSVANYFKEHGWQSGGLVALRLAAEVAPAESLLSDDLEPGLSPAMLAQNGIVSPLPIPADNKVKILTLESESGPEHWLGFWNFYVITRYNHSVLYAMAVYQLAQDILAGHEAEAALAHAGKPDA